jgi:capsular exopolysaccharide synthesis family protein
MNSAVAQFSVETVAVRPEARIVVHTDPRGPTADRLRLLRLRLNQSWNQETLKRLLVTSPQPHDGKSTIAMNLAITLSEEGERSVLLLEGDLHRATISRELGLAGRPGVAECLEKDATPVSFIRRIEPLGFCFLPAGNAQTNPSELVQETALAALLKPLSQHFDWILVDSPPVIPLSDALSWRHTTDATLLVTRAGQTLTQGTEEALNLIGRKHVFAVLLNGIEGLDRQYKKYYQTYGNHKNS